MNRFLILFLVMLGFQVTAVETIEGTAHEAFLTSLREGKPAHFIDKQPPRPVQEMSPAQTDPRAIWIPGYWCWDNVRNDYIWIGGIWRRPPPGLEWISGTWQQTEKGWLWSNGFWSDKSEIALDYIKTAPPQPLEEVVPAVPGVGYFWVPGFWKYDATTKQFNWLGGRWEHFDPNWMLVPTHYQWRPQGFVFVNAYWDWTLKERGQPYASLFIPEEARNGYVYTPTEVVDPDLFVRYEFFSYPDYLYFFQYSYYYSPEFWVNFQFAPPWWGWEGWWTITWKNQWELWWWWTHPNAAAPLWITAAVAGTIPPPSNALIDLMQKIQLPARIEEKKEAVSTEFVRPKGKLLTTLASVPKPTIPTASNPSKLPTLAQVPVKPTFPGSTAIYRQRPASDTQNITPAIRQPALPSQRPNLDWFKSRVPTDIYKTPAQTPSPTYQRPEYQPPQEEKSTNPSGETKKVYKPSTPTYTAPASDYQPASYKPSRIQSSFSDDIYSPPSTNSYQLRESPSSEQQPINYFSPDVEESQHKGEGK